jgi:hypothetical protein
VVQPFRAAGAGRKARTKKGHRERVKGKGTHRMHRRQFLATGTATALGLALSRGSHAAESEQNKALIEIRFYHFASPEKMQAYEKFIGQTEIPALNRAGINPVGAFKLLAKDNPTLKLTEDSTDLYVVLPHKSAESLSTLEDRLAADEAYQKAGAEMLVTPQKQPAFLRYESRLLSAFDLFPQVQVPTQSPKRLIQLRTYESHDRERARKKLEMFQQGGEIPIFKRCGMNGVFFGECLIGDKMPNLTYMLSFEDDEAQKHGWAAFGKDPDWKKLSKDPAYKDTVSNITNLLLRPCEGSQI